MKKLLLAAVALTLMLAPQVASAQDAAAGPAADPVIVITKFKAPFGEDGAKVMQFIEKVFVPQEEANPHVQSFYVLNHLYGEDAGDILMVRVYATWADVEAPCGEPCRALAETMPEPGTPEGDELQELGAVFTKYYAHHSDEIYSGTIAVEKN